MPLLMEPEEHQVLLEEDLRLSEKVSVVRIRSKATLSTQILSIQTISQSMMFIKICFRTWTKLPSQMMELLNEI